jgi:hypothetical protein
LPENKFRALSATLPDPVSIRLANQFPASAVARTAKITQGFKAVQGSPDSFVSALNPWEFSAVHGADTGSEFHADNLCGLAPVPRCA